MRAPDGRRRFEARRIISAWSAAAAPRA